MRLTRRLMTVLLAGALVAVPASVAQGAPGGGGKPDNPSQGQGNPGGNSGGNSGNSKNPKGNLYSDLWVIARDARGVPITVTYTVTGEEGEETSTCVQPITFDGTTGFPALTGTDVYPYQDTARLIPLAGEDAPALELEPCEVLPEYAGYVNETDLGRLNLGRSPERVLSKQLGDVELFLAGEPASLDASGRLVVNDVALDSPLANLAAYQAILETGSIGTTAIPAVDLMPWEMTAAMLAAGAPKEDFEINVDVVQYLNRILTIPNLEPNNGILGTLPVGDTGEAFLDFSGLSYERSATFPGCVTYVDPADGYNEVTSSLQTVVFKGDAGTPRQGIDAYVNLAEDARDVLVWVHAMGILVLDVDPITTSDLCTS